MGNEVTIRNGRVYGMEFEEYFNVLLHNGDNVAIKVKCDFDGIPVEIAARVMYSELKVKFRPHVKAMTTEALKKAFNNQTISWRDMLYKESARSTIEAVGKTDEEIDAQIARLTAMKSNTPADDTENDED